MTLVLPSPIADYVAANSRLDLDGMLKPFAPDAIVRDDGGQHCGRAEIRSWIDNASLAAQAVFTPDSCHFDNDRFVVSGLTHGQFKGSPARFTMRFQLEDNVIRALDIT